MAKRGTVSHPRQNRVTARRRRQSRMLSVLLAEAPHEDWQQRILHAWAAGTMRPATATDQPTPPGEARATQPITPPGEARAAWPTMT